MRRPHKTKKRLETKSRVFSGGEVIKELASRGVKINAPELSYYLKLGVVVPVLDSSGRGKVKQFSYKNMLQIGAARILEFYGIRPSALKSIMRQLWPKMNEIEDRDVLSFIDAIFSNYWNRLE